MPLAKITMTDRDEAVEAAKDAADLDCIAQIRTQIISLTKEIAEREQELFSLQSSLAGEVSA